MSPFIGRLFKGPKAYKINAKLREAVADINWDQDAFRLYYVTLQQTAENAPAIEEQGITPVVDLPDLQERTTLELLDEKGLNVALRDALTLEEGNSTPVSIRFSSDSDEKPWLHYLDEDGRESYVGRVNGTQLAEILRAHKSQLFALNIRNYVGDNVTNKAIRKTATSNPNCFYYYNNGISALATRIELDQQDKSGRTLRCESFSVINGAQTVRSLLKAQAEDSAAVRSVELLIRITEFRSKKVKGEQVFLENVTKFNNTQNAVRKDEGLSTRTRDPEKGMQRKSLSEWKSLQRLSMLFSLAR